MLLKDKVVQSKKGSDLLILLVINKRRQLGKEIGADRTADRRAAAPYGLSLSKMS